MRLNKREAPNAKQGGHGQRRNQSQDSGTPSDLVHHTITLFLMKDEVKRLLDALAAQEAKGSRYTQLDVRFPGSNVVRIDVLDPK